MIEWEKPDQGTADEIGQRLMDFIEKAEFGSTEYKAVSDYLFLRQSEERLSTLQRNSISHPDDPESRLHWKGQVRIEEQKIALLRHQIYEKQSTLKGYSKAFVHVGIGFEHELLSAVRKKAQSLYVNNELQQRFHVEKIIGEYIDRAENIVNINRD